MQASESNLLDTIGDVVDEVTAPVEDVVKSVADATLGTAAPPPGPAPQADPAPGPAPEPEPAPEPQRAAPLPEPANEPTAELPPAPVDELDQEPLLSSHAAREPEAPSAPESTPAQASAAESETVGQEDDLLAGLLDDVAQTARPLAPLTDVARQIVQLEGSTDEPSDVVEDANGDADLTSITASLNDITAGQDAQTTNLVGAATSLVGGGEASGGDSGADEATSSLADRASDVVSKDALGEVLDDLGADALGGEVLAGGLGSAASPLGIVSSTATPLLNTAIAPVDHLVSTTAAPLLTTLTEPVNGMVDSTAAPVLSTVTPPVGEVVHTLIDPASGVLSDVVNVAALAGVTGQVAALLPIVTEPVGAVVAPLGALLGPVTTVVAPILEPVTTPLAPLLSPLTQTVGFVVAPLSPVLDPVLQTLSPVLGPILESLEPVTTALAPITAPLLEVLDPVLDVLDPVVAPLLDPLLDELDPVLYDLGLPTSGENIAWALSASDHLDATSVPAPAGESPAAIPAALTGFASAGADVSTNLVIPTTAGAASAGSGHGVPPAVGSASTGSGGDRSSGPSMDLYAAAPLLLGSMFLRRERCGTAALAESPRQPGVRPD